MILYPVSAPASESEASTELEKEESFIDSIIHIVVPSEDFFKEEFKKLDTKLKEKLPFQTYIETIGRFKEVSAALDGDATALNIEFDYEGEQVKIEIGSYISPYLQQIRMIITGIYVLFIAHYNYRQIMHLIRGTNYSGMKAGSGGATEEEINL